MRVLRTTTELQARGWTRGRIRGGERKGLWRLIVKGVYGEGPEPPSALDIARADALLAGGIATGALSGELHRWDSVVFDPSVKDVVVPLTNPGRRSVRRAAHLPEQVIELAQVRCTDGPTTLWALAQRLDDTTWEQALESALRQDDVTPDDISAMAAGSDRRSARVRRVVKARSGLDVPPTESLLETLMVQLIRTIPGAPQPERQVRVYNERGELVARVDLAWPSLGIFIELDGQQHKGQPVYDASRQNAVVAATGWLVGRFTWYEITRLATASARRLVGLLEQALRRPLVAN